MPIEQNAVFHVHKFIPPRCPVCRHEFGPTQEGFGKYAAGEGESFAESLSNEKLEFPELAESELDLDFVACAGCGNVTMRVTLEAKAQVTSVQEADRMVSEEGFTYYAEATEAGDIAENPGYKLEFPRSEDEK